MTPTLKVVKEAYPDCHLIVNTNRPSLLKGNPYVDEIGTKNEGVFLGYPAPDGGVLPTQNHILSDWNIVCEAYNIKTEKPELIPQLFISCKTKSNLIGVQVRHKRNYHSKRVWPHFDDLSMQIGFQAIADISSGDKMTGLVKEVAKYKLVICAEGGISHVRAALGLPAIVLFGGFSDPIWTGYNFHDNLVSDIPCKHCYNLSPCKNNLRCWDEFSMEDIIEKTKSID